MTAVLPAPVVAALSPAAVRETHISWVLLAGDRAYKLKKPVTLPFLDFSTRELRANACRQEVELNRRFAPDVYLGVLHVTDDDGEPVDDVVMMRRMPDDRRLSTLVRAGEVAAADLDALAKVIADVHAAAAPVDATLAFDVASRRGVRRLWLDAFDVMRPSVGDVFDEATFARAQHLALGYLAGRGPLLQCRIDHGWIRDGHGDLLADDIFLLDDGPRVLDCIEFDEHLRVGDVLLDIAFLAMDLERLGAPAAAQALVRRWAELVGDRYPRSLLHHYIAYRAAVRAKVAALRVAQGDHASRGSAAEHLSLAARHLEQGRVVVVLLGGLPGSGKSTLADAIEQRLPVTVLRSDETRKELAGLSSCASAAAPINGGIYAARATDRTYETLLSRAGQLAMLGESVVLDASWSADEHRDAARQAAKRVGAEVVEIECVAPHPVLEERLSRRRSFGSDADMTVAAALADRWSPWPSATQVWTDRPLHDVVADAVRLLPPA